MSIGAECMNSFLFSNVLFSSNKATVGKNFFVRAVNLSESEHRSRFNFSFEDKPDELNGEDDGQYAGGISLLELWDY